MAQSIQVPVTQTGLEASIEAAAKKAGRNLQINLGTNAKSISSLSQPLGKITGQANEFTKSMEAANARVFAFGASVGVINAVSKAFSLLVTSTIKVEKSLTEINVVLNQNSKDLDKFGNQLFDVAKKTGQSFEVAAAGALELSRQGLEAADVVKRLNDALVLSRLSGLDATQSVEGLTAAINSFKDAGISSEQIINKLVNVSQKYAVSERDLIEGIKRSASVAEQAGVSFDELVGIITTVQERTARGGAVIGNAFKTIFSKIQDKGALQDLQDLGIKVTDLQGRILPATDILKNLAVEFEGLSQIQQTDIAKKLGGVYQLSNLLAALKDLGSENSKYTKIVELSSKSTNEAYQKNAALNETLAALINKVTVSAEQLGATLGKIGITDSAKTLLNFFNGILEGIQKILGEESAMGDFVRGIVKGIGALVTGPGLALFGAIIAKLSKDLVAFGFSSLKSFLGIGNAAQEIANVQKTISNSLLTNKGIQEQILQIEGMALSVEEKRALQTKFFTDALNTQLAAMKQMQAISTAIAPGVRASTGSGKRAANGYIPQEAADIRKGVGGARAGDRPVEIPNFAFGGGKRGTMVAHTGEYIVPNYAGGGSAIFNRDMVASMGLPSGAKRIGAAGGFIPNFVDLGKNVGQVFKMTPSELKQFMGTSKFANAPDSDPVKQAALTKAGSGTSAKKSSNLVINAQSDLGGLGVVGVGGNSGLLDTREALSSMSSTEIGILRSMGFKGDSVSILGIEGRTLQDLNQTTQEQAQKDFRAKVNKIFAAPMRSLGSDIIGRTFSGNDASEYAAKLNQNTANDPALFSDSVLGGLFESAIRLSTKTASQIGGFNDTDANAAFDFEEGSQATSEFKKAFRFNQLYKADAKKTINSKTIQSLIGKAIRDSGTQNKIKKKVKSAASGYIPNFVNPLSAAIERERAAGVPDSQIYIDKNESLKSASNPMGWMVANRRDEPAGGAQGINRARREGRNPQTYGAAGGFIPSFADLTQASVGTSNKVIEANLSKFNQLIKDLNAELADGKKTYDEAQKEVNDFAQGLKKVGQSSKDKLASGGIGQLQKPVQEAAKAHRDLLGPIFAVQAGMSLLTGATNDSSSALGKYTNIVSSSIGTFSTMAFAVQGLQGASGKLGKVFSALGPYGMAAAGAFSAFQAGIEIYKEASGANAEAAKSAALLADASNKASSALTNLSEIDKVRLDKTSSELKSSANVDILGGLLTGLDEEVDKAIDLAVKSGIDPALVRSYINASQKVIEIPASSMGSSGFASPSAAGAFATAGTRAVSTKTITTDADRKKLIEQLAAKVTESTKEIQTFKGKSLADFENPESIKKIIEDIGKEKGFSPEKSESLAIAQKELLAQEKITKEKEKSEKIDQVSLELAKNQLTSAIDIAVARQRVTDSLDKEKIAAGILGNLTESQNDDLEYRISLRGVERESISEASELLKSQISSVEGIAGKTKEINDLKERFNNLSSEDLLNHELTKKLLDDILGISVEAGRVTEIQKQGQLDKLGIIKEELNIAKQNLEVQKQQEQSSKNERDAIRAAISDAKSISNSREFNQTLDINSRLDESKNRVSILNSSLNQPGLTTDEKRSIRDQINLEGIKSANYEKEASLLRAKENAKSIAIGALPENAKNLESQIQESSDFQSIKETLKLALNPLFEGASKTSKADLDAAIKAIENLEKGSNASADSIINSLKLQAALDQKHNDVSSSLDRMIDHINNADQRFKDLSYQLLTVTSASEAAKLAREQNLESNLKAIGEGPGTKEEKAAAAAAAIKQNNALSIGQKLRENSSFNKTGDEILGELEDKLIDSSLTFKDNLIDGITQAVEGATTMGEVFNNITLELARNMTKIGLNGIFQNLSSAALQSGGGTGGGWAQAIGSIFGSMKMASGGKVSGGSGSKDDVPAMLMGGEYVINKKAASKYGHGFLEALNNGSLQGYAKGGSVQGGRGGYFIPGTRGRGGIEGRDNLLNFATQSFTSGAGDRIRNRGNYASINLEGESTRLTQFGRTTGPQAEAIRAAKGEAFGLYLQDLKAEEERKTQEEAKKKALRNQIIMAAVSIVGGAVVSGATNAYKNYSINKQIESGTVPRGSIVNEGGFTNSDVSGTFSNVIDGVPTTALPIAGPGSNSPVSDAPSVSGFGHQAPSLPSFNQAISDQMGATISNDGIIVDLPDNLNGMVLPSRATGGSIPYRGGIDTVPAMLSGGEFVMNRAAAQNIGAGNLQALNSGATSLPSQEQSKELNEKVLAKLDELIEATGNGGSITINVDGATGKSSQTNDNKSADSKQQLARQIRDAVIKVINDEKRLGGQLRRSM